MFWVFLIWVAEVPQINYLLPDVMFFIDSAMFCVFIVLQILSLLFICKNLLAIMRNSSYSWKSLFPVGNKLLRVLNTLISLLWDSYEGSFQVCDGRWWKKIHECQALKLGDAPMNPHEIFKETQASKLGDAPVHPLLYQQSSVRPSPCYIFITSYVSAMLGASLYLLLSLF